MGPFYFAYPEGKWTEEARIRVENFTLAQVPSSAAAAGGGTPAEAGAAAAGPAAYDAQGAPPATPTKGAAAKAAKSTASGTSASAPAAASAAPAAKSAATAPSGGFAVQLGAFKSGAGAAKEHWAELQQEYPSLLAGMTSKVVPKKTAEGSLYRLQATGLSEKHARDVCSALRAKSEPCIVVPPPTARRRLAIQQGTLRHLGDKACHLAPKL